MEIICDHQLWNIQAEWFCLILCIMPLVGVMSQDIASSMYHVVCISLPHGVFIHVVCLSLVIWLFKHMVYLFYSFDLIKLHGSTNTNINHHFQKRLVGMLDISHSNFSVMWYGCGPNVWDMASSTNTIF